MVTNLLEVFDLARLLLEVVSKLRVTEFQVTWAETEELPHGFPLFSILSRTIHYLFFQPLG